MRPKRRSTNFSMSSRPALPKRFGADRGLHDGDGRYRRWRRTCIPRFSQRWKAYLAKPEEFHPFLESWFQGERRRRKRSRFRGCLLEIAGGKEDGGRGEPATGGGRKEDRARRSHARSCCRAVTGLKRISIPAHTFLRSRWNAIDSSPRTEHSGKIRAAEVRSRTDSGIAGAGSAARIRSASRTKFEDLKKALPPQYPYLQGAGEF